MAITKILAKNNRLDVLIRYVTNQDKTEEQVLTAYLMLLHTIQSS